MADEHDTRELNPKFARLLSKLFRRWMEDPEWRKRIEAEAREPKKRKAPKKKRGAK